MFICSRFTLVNKDENGLRAAPLFCRRWSCPICGPKRAWRLRTEAKEGRPNTFLTLTVRYGEFDTPSNAACALVKAWRNIRQQAKRELGIDKLPFLAVFEKTKRGWPHLHILMRAPFIEQDWISEKCAKYLNSPVVYIERIYNLAKSAWYIAKYCTKDPQIWDGVKRYWRSMDYLPPQEAVDEGEIDQTEVVVLRKPYDEVRQDQFVGGVTAAEDLKGRRVKIGWWTGQMEFR